MRRALAIASMVMVLLCAAVGASAHAQVRAEQAGPSKPGAKDLCPVCGMIVAKYPAWTASVTWADGRVEYFDGTQDLFKYLQALAQYAPGRAVTGIRTIIVTDFYDLKPVDARQAFYVIGSDVLGPMGHELVPLATKADADEFIKDHRGATVLRFGEVTPEVVARVEAGRQ